MSKPALCPSHHALASPKRCGSAVDTFRCVVLIVLGRITPEFATLYFIGVACVGALLIIEHSLVKPGDLSKVGMAFFTVNGIISLLLGTLAVIDLFI